MLLKPYVSAGQRGSGEGFMATVPSVSTPLTSLEVRKHQQY